MDKTAHEKQTVLVTDAASLLGQAITESLLELGYIVYGCAKHYPQENILQNPNFTLIDIDLSQPFPEHFPVFDLIIHLSSEKLDKDIHFSTTTKNIISNTKSEVTNIIVCLPISSATNFSEQDYFDENKQKNLKILLIGDIYGPELLSKNINHESYYSQNKLTKLILQAVNKDKIVLEKEGLETIYPIFIEDAKKAILKFITVASTKKPRFVSLEPQTSLSVSYELQNLTRLVLQKEIGIFFTGDQNETIKYTEPVIHISDINFSPKYNLQNGLKKTLESFHPKLEEKRPEENYQDEKLIKAEVFNKLPQKPLISRKPKLTFFSQNQISKKVIITVFVILILITAKISIDVFLGYQNIKSAKSDLEKGEFSDAKKKAENSLQNFKSAQQEFTFTTYPLTVVLPGKINSINNSLKSAQHASLAITYFSDGAISLSKNLSIITSENSGSDVLSFEDSNANFSKASFEATYASQLAKSSENLIFLKSKMENSNQGLQQLAQVSQISFELSNLITNITGANETKTYLILIENNTELRPGGGFIGNYGLLTFEKGKLKSLDINDIYSIDGQLKEKIDPPPQLTQKLGVKQLYLRDSNWTTDFEINAKTAKDFFKKETGKDVDGVIAIDLSFMQNLLEKMGPIKLDDYKEEISAQNIFDKGEYYSEIGFFPGSTQKKDFFASLSKALINKIISSISNQSLDKTALLAVINSVKESLAKKDILLSFDEPTVSSFVKSKGWNNLVPPVNFNVSNDSFETKDFIALSEANIGANKVNRYIKRNINYDMTIGRDANLIATLNLTYQNTSPADTWPAGTYVNYLRILVPPSSGIEDFQIDGNSDLKKVEVSSDANLAVFATLLEVPVGKTIKVTIKYRIPKNIKLETAPTYHLYVQKQPGTGNDPFTFSFNLPNYLKIDTLNDSAIKSIQNYSQNLDLSQDREFTIKIAKK